MSSPRSRARRSGAPAAARPTAELAPRAALVVVIVAILFAAAVRVRVSDVPLERDEGEYAYAGQLLLQGIPPYQLAFNMKFPGTYYAYAAILAIFGESARGIHLGLLLVNAATTALVFLLGKRLFGNLAGAVAGCAFALLSLNREIMGVFAHATHFVILPVVAGLLLALHAIESHRARTLLAAGAMFGLAVLMKQHAVFFVPLAAALVAYAALSRERAGWRTALLRSLWLLAGAAAPFVLLVSVFALQGVLGRFWFWTFQYASEYVTRIPISRAPQLFLSGLAEATRWIRPVWIAALAGAVALAARRGWGHARIVVGGFLAASFLALCPGFYFRQHYFIVLLPVAALLVGVAAASAAQLLAARMPARLALLAVCGAGVVLAAIYVVGERGYLFSWSARDLSRARYGANPFVESPEIARYLRERTGPDDKIAVLGSEPQIYFYAGRRSATGYIYMYPLMEPQRFASTMQEEMIRQIEAAHPAYLVLVRVSTSWLASAQSDQRLLEWTGRYSRECYDVVGVADIHSSQTTTYAWDREAAVYEPRSKNLVVTFHRKSDAACVAPPAGPSVR